MGISNVAVNTFDSSGSQSLCRTNEYSGDEEVKSSFIPKCQKMYISGSGEMMIPGSLRTFPTTKSVDTFKINSDTDAISDITLNIEFKLKRQTLNTGNGRIIGGSNNGSGYQNGETVKFIQGGIDLGGEGTVSTFNADPTNAVLYVTTTKIGSGYLPYATVQLRSQRDDFSGTEASATYDFVQGVTTWNANVSKDIILGLIDKVEIKLGSLTAQTLTADDIYIRNLTELGQPFTFSAPFETSPDIFAVSSDFSQRPTAENNVWKHYDTSDDAVLVIQAACSIPFIGRSNDMSRSLLQAGALTNAVNVKVYYNNIYTSNKIQGDSHYQILAAGDGGPFVFGTTPPIPVKDDFLDLSYFKSFITVKTHKISETEKNFISKNIIHRVVNTSTNVTKDIPKNTTLTAPDESGVTDVEVDLENVSLNVSHLLIGIRLPHVHNEKLKVKAAGYPHSRDLTTITKDNQMSTPFSVIDSQTYNRPTQNWTAPDNLFGYMPNAIESMELVIGSDRTGFIKGASAKIGGCENFTLLNSDKNSAHYIVTLAEKAFDTSGVPFSKCNSKKLLIKLNNYIFKTVGVTPNPLSDATYTQNAIITVTACGTKVQSVVGGSMSFM